jgi:MFS family permease
VLVSEISKSDHRGAFLGYVFIANYLGISLAYWMDFGLAFLDGGNSPVRWRFLLAFQCLPAMLLLLGVRMLPDSPRFLASVGRNKEAREVLVCLRGIDDDHTEREYNEIISMAESSRKSSPIEFFKVILGLDEQKAPHLGRRAWLAIFLQIMASWTGITAVTAYSPVLLRQAGYSQLTQNGLAGGLNTVGIVGTIISAQIVDKLGRRTCLMCGAAGLFAVNLIVSKQLPLSFGLIVHCS